MQSSASVDALSAQSIAEASRLIGVPLRRRQHNTEAARPTLFRWVKAIGDRNPLWLDDGYARRTAFGTIVAPPCWLFSVDDTVVAPKLPGCHAIYAGVDFEFYRWVRLGDEIGISARLLDVQDRNGRFCGPMALQTGEVIYTNRAGVTVAKATSKVLRTPRQPAVALAKYGDWQKYRYSRGELHQIEDDYDAEEIRGSSPRFWEDVHEDTLLQPIVRGPLTSEDMLQFICATRPVAGFKEFHQYRRRHPAAAFLDPQSGTWEAWDASMLNDDVARTFGFPFAHDAGIDRISWLGNLLTDWMGDTGFLRRLSVDLLLPNIYGDATWCRGRIIGKSRRDGEALTEIEVWCENQRGQTTARGSATVALPSRAIPALRTTS